ncbi:MAG TPA: 6-phosphogluconolactonase [Verrucomicrobiae bacterium]|nr:6-phosphogluconolactonase [Verrucomicrobiae bacterium]
MSFDLIPFATADELAREVAAGWLVQIEAAAASNKPHLAALSGGRIAVKLFGCFVEQARTRKTPLANAHFFWADERCVPPDDAESNYRMARELLFEPLRISEDHIHRVKGEREPERAAAEAEEDIRRYAALNQEGQPVLQLVLLGMGEDGHVASLFPGEPEALQSSKAVYRAVRNSPKPPPNRVTLGYPAIAAADHVWVVVSGAGKEKALRESVIVSGRTPLARVLHLRHATKVFSDIGI